MAKLKIVWTETATIVFQQILTFYNVRNGNTQYSRSIYTMVRDVLQLVAKYPYMYKATSVPNIRVFHCDYFKVYYRVLEKQILVEAVFDTRRKPDVCRANLLPKSSKRPSAKVANSSKEIRRTTIRILSTSTAS